MCYNANELQNIKRKELHTESHTSVQFRIGKSRVEHRLVRDPGLGGVERKWGLTLGAGFLFRMIKGSKMDCSDGRTNVNISQTTESHT